MEAGRGAALPGANQRRCVNPNEGGGESRSDLNSGAKARGAGAFAITPSARPRILMLIYSLY
ncbi:hypothetical protein [Pragia fontium]|uniref:hypothetical protein n=1 Tax=Pragia fontium TaxID=82985 RepID=UPI0011141B9B|nr:hypothetical protein [Pragia fontium]